MSETREHVSRIDLPVPPEQALDAILTPSSVRSWWKASVVIVLPRSGGSWAAAWGDEDDPDFITVARIRTYEPGRRLVLADYQYYSRSGPPPFEADFRVEFQVDTTPQGCVLQVTQSGFPCDAAADDFLKACEIGWRDSLESLRLFLESNPAR